MAESFLGSGHLYMDRLTEGKVSQGFDRGGNAVTFEIQADAEVKEQTSTGRDDYGQVIASATITKPSKLKIALNQLDRHVLAMAFLGDQEALAITGGTVTDEALTVIKGKYVALDHRGISAVTVVRRNGEDAGTWAATTAYTAGTYIKPTATPTRFYKCTTLGTSAGTEPTWPTGGGTVTDGTVVWTDMGTITAVVTTDYLLNTRLGLVKVVDTSLIVDGEVLEVDYTYESQTGYKVSGSTQPTIRVSLMLDGKNLANGKDCIVTVWEAQIRPTSAVDFLKPDFTSVEFEGTMVTPEGKTAPFHVEEID